MRQTFAIFKSKSPTLRESGKTKARKQNFYIFRFLDMTKRKKIPKRKLEKDHRREKITLDGFFGNKWRIATIDKDMGRYVLIIYREHRRILRHFSSFSQLLGILQGIFLCQLLDNNFIKNEQTN